MAAAGVAAEAASAIIQTAESDRRATRLRPGVGASLPRMMLRRCFRGFCSRPEFSSGTITVASTGLTWDRGASSRFVGERAKRHGIEQFIERRDVVLPIVPYRSAQQIGRARQDALRRALPTGAVFAPQPQGAGRAQRD